jgi:type IV secretion system protein VirB5
MKGIKNRDRPTAYHHSKNYKHEIILSEQIVSLKEKLTVFFKPSKSSTGSFSDRTANGTKNTKKVSDNPYVAGSMGQREWNDRYLNLSKAIRHWQLAFFVSSGLLILFGIAMTKMAMESHVQPFVVETKDGIPYATLNAVAVSDSSQKIASYAVNQFIINSRMIISDEVAEKSILDKVYAYSAGDTIPFLAAYYKTNNPFDIATRNNVSVNIINSMPLSKDTFQVVFEETVTPVLGGGVPKNLRWIANVTYHFGEVNKKFVNENPFGVYITQVSWSQSRM